MNQCQLHQWKNTNKGKDPNSLVQLVDRRYRRNVELCIIIHFEDYMSLQFRYFHHRFLLSFEFNFTGQLKNGSKESTLPYLNVLEGLLEKVFHSPLMKNVCRNV